MSTISFIFSGVSIISPAAYLSHVTNSKDYKRVSVVRHSEVKVGQEILDLEGTREKETSTNENPQMA